MLYDRKGELMKCMNPPTLKEVENLLKNLNRGRLD